MRTYVNSGLTFFHLQSPISDLDFIPTAFFNKDKGKSEPLTGPDIECLFKSLGKADFSTLLFVSSGAKNI